MPLSGISSQSADSTQGTTESQLAVFRELFPIVQRSVYLNSCAKGPLCIPVREAYYEYLRQWDEYGAPWQLWMQRVDELKQQFADFIGAAKHEIALTLSVSSGAGSIASCFDYAKRRKVVLSDQEYPTMAQLWLAQRSCGADVQFVRSSAACPTPDDYSRAIDDYTLIAPLTHVSFRNGSTLPVREIVDICHHHGTYVLLDDYQCTGTRPIDVKQLGVDFLVTGMLKYMLGPAGIAFIYVREDLIEKCEPRLTGWFGREDPFSLDIGSVSYARAARRFETGTFPVGAVEASLAALKVVVAMSPARVAGQIATLTRHVLGRLRELGFSVTTPSDSSGPMVAIEMDDVQGLSAQLAERGILVAVRNNLFRASFHGFNTLAETDQLLSALSEWRSSTR